MSFDWLEFLVLAESLHSATMPPSEARYRSASSRAYYAAFHLAAHAIEAKREWQRRHTGTDHQELYRVLKKFGNTPKGRIGTKLERLHMLRLRVDYEDDVQEPSKISEAAIALAREVHNDLKFI